MTAALGASILMYNRVAAASPLPVALPPVTLLADADAAPAAAAALGEALDDATIDALMPPPTAVDVGVVVDVVAVGMPDVPANDAVNELDDEPTAPLLVSTADAVNDVASLSDRSLELAPSGATCDEAKSCSFDDELRSLELPRA